jgi:hypothetical protein
MARYQCKDKDCSKECGDNSQLHPLVFSVPNRTYRKDDPLLRNYKWPHASDTVTYHGYRLLKCPHCRGTLIDLATGKPPPSEPL